jgi:hypothetical protein
MRKISLQSNNGYDKNVEVGPIVGLYPTIAHHMCKSICYAFSKYCCLEFDTNNQPHGIDLKDIHLFNQSSRSVHIHVDFGFRDISLLMLWVQHCGSFNSYLIFFSSIWNINGKSSILWFIFFG